MATTKQKLPADYVPDLWLSPLEFQALIGYSIAAPNVSYASLFREDGFAKCKADLEAMPELGPFFGKKPCEKGGVFRWLLQKFM